MSTFFKLFRPLTHLHPPLHFLDTASKLDTCSTSSSYLHWSECVCLSACPSVPAVGPTATENDRRWCAGRLPVVKNLDFQLSRRWQFKKYRFRAGIKAYNIFGADASRDVQNHLSSPSFGQFFVVAET